ncbi:MAG: hypothetical protein M3R69_08785 [Acidobacteriota bacterium]|nr:hypothetical protein [Acidobacteriota bacterium]
MANDPGLSRDTCIYMEAVSGDGGVHTNPTWWLSPDIELTGPISGPDKADPGQINPVNVRSHNKGGQCTSTGDEAIIVELWVGNPSIVMTPDNPASTSLVTKMGSPMPLPGNSATQLIDWTPPGGLPPTDPQGPGHKCLIARCYPDSLTASPIDFFLPDDPHVAMHNICIVPCGGPGAANRPGQCGLEVTTASLNRKEREAVTLRVVPDTRPDQFVRATVLKLLEKLPGFKKLAVRPVPRFNFELRGFPGARINDQTKPGCLGILSGGKRYYEAGINLEVAQVTRFNFVADLSGSEFGDAHIFHLTQSSAKQPRQGGLTIVMVAV